MSNVALIYERTLEHFLAPVRGFLQDSTISEVMINGFDEIYVERGGKIERTDASFKDETGLQAAMRNVAQFVGKRLTSSAEVLLFGGEPLQDREVIEVKSTEPRQAHLLDRRSTNDSTEPRCEQLSFETTAATNP